MAKIVDKVESNEKPKAKVWLNIGKMQDKSDKSGQYLLSPFFGTAVDTADTKRMSKAEKELQAAILKFAEEKGEGTHDIKLTVQLHVSSDTPKAVEEVNFDL